MRRILIAAMLVASFVLTQTPRSSANQNGNEKLTNLPAQTSDQVEPNAGNWRTWVISSGKDYRVLPPPNPAQTQAELRALADLISQNDEQDRQQIAFWDAGAPAYRWIDLINARRYAGLSAIPSARDVEVENEGESMTSYSRKFLPEVVPRAALARADRVIE